MLTIQIVPKIFPAVDGVGDYALSLAHQLRQNFNIETHFVVGDLNWSGNKKVDGFNISKVAQHDSSVLFSLLNDIGEEASSVILQYVGCGYARRGCPFWLLKGLEHYKTAYPAKKLVTMFHETYGSGPPYYGADPPWISAFWLSPLQKNIAGRLVISSNYCITSREKFREQLFNLSHGHNSHISVIPVFSNVGEATHLPLLKDRQSTLVLFGSRNSRARVYEQFPDAIRDTCRMLEIEKIYDIGPSTELNVTEFDNVPVISLGEKTLSEIGKILLESRAGILNYHPDFLAKSGVYAAYSAYGLIPIIVSSNTTQANGTDGLFAGEHYWAINRIDKNLNLEVGQTIAENAYAWYQSHNLKTHTQTFANKIGLDFIYR
jgi:hypothetical protein